MLGAIIGDYIGSRFEFNPTNDYNFELFFSDCDITDDTICTVAVARALLFDHNYKSALHRLCRRYPNPKGSYGGRFAEWVKSENPEPYNSFGNGSAMRVSPIAWYYAFTDVNPDDDPVQREAAASAACTHNHPEGIKGAVAVAWAIYDCLKMHDKVDTINKEVIIEYGLKRALSLYPDSLSIRLEDVQNRFDETCQGTVPVALWIISESNSFEDAIRRAVSLGADADTLGAIVGSIAEAIWGIPTFYKRFVLAALPDGIRRTLNEFRRMYKWNMGQEEWFSKSELDRQVPIYSPATASDWPDLAPMPDSGEKLVTLHPNFALSARQMVELRKGKIPQGMPYKWFIYCTEDTIYFHRSWSGLCPFKVHFHAVANYFIADTITIDMSTRKDDEDAQDLEIAKSEYFHNLFYFSTPTPQYRLKDQRDEEPEEMILDYAEATEFAIKKLRDLTDVSLSDDDLAKECEIILKHKDIEMLKRHSMNIFKYAENHKSKLLAPNLTSVFIRLDKYIEDFRFDLGLYQEPFLTKEELLLDETSWIVDQLAEYNKPSRKPVSKKELKERILQR